MGFYFILAYVFLVYLVGQHLFSKTENGNSKAGMGNVLPPTPRGIHVARSKTSPSGNNSTYIPEGVEESQNSSSLPWMCQLCNHGWSCDASKAYSDSNEATTDHELGIAKSRGLDDSTDERKNRTDIHSSFSPIYIGNGRRGEGADKSTNENDCCEKTNSRCIWIAHI